MRRWHALPETRHRIMPALVGRRSRLVKTARQADRLHREFRAPFPRQIVAGNKLPQPRVKRPDVVILQIHLDKGLPVVIALVNNSAIKRVPGKIERLAGLHGQRGEINDRVGRPVKQQAIPRLKPGVAQIQPRITRKMRRANELAFTGIRPAMQRANHVTAVNFQRTTTVQHHRLTVATDVGDKVNAAFGASERLRITTTREHGVVAQIRHHQLMARIAGPAREQQFPFSLQQGRVEIGRRGQL